ncbi:DUF4150 domain-containing protein [Desulfovibrio inopinatus]|uniref:DUF4150 domain-containing protein n=1 Tax=Desulfovibrio inopinatus TaxID=102109 RepID=UPI00042474BF|nr:DUF4150 domain-containing protein [Desulfovibrio inopinatus]
MLACTREAGACRAFPDVCKTPAPVGMLPIPYPNFAQLECAECGTFSENVMISGANAITLRTVIPMSQGDDAGVEGGVVSEVDMGPAGFTSGSMTVFIGGSPAVKLMSTTKQNGEEPNCIGAVLSPSQSVVDIQT